MNVAELVQAKLHWLGHDSFRWDGSVVVYFDPWQLEGDMPQADLVLVSHEHHDHCSPEDVKAVSGPDTIVLAGGIAEEQLPGAQMVRPGERLSVAGVEVEMVPAYNTNKFRSPGVPFHPEDAGHVGFIVAVDGARVYFAGDTDHIPEMADFDCDVALLPVSGTYVMTVEEAVAAAEAISPQVVVPMHYGAGIGTGEDGERFAELYGGPTVVM